MDAPVIILTRDGRVTLGAGEEPAAAAAGPGKGDDEESRPPSSVPKTKKAKKDDDDETKGACAIPFAGLAALALVAVALGVGLGVGLGGGSSSSAAVSSGPALLSLGFTFNTSASSATNNFLNSSAATLLRCGAANLTAASPSSSSSSFAYISAYDASGNGTWRPVSPCDPINVGRPCPPGFPSISSPAGLCNPATIQSLTASSAASGAPTGPIGAIRVTLFVEESQNPVSVVQSLYDAAAAGALPAGVTVANATSARVSSVLQGTSSSSSSSSGSSGSADLSVIRPTSTSTSTASATSTPTPSSTPTGTPTSTSTSTPTPTSSSTLTPSTTPSLVNSASATPTTSPTGTVTPTSSPTPSPTVSDSPTQTPSRTSSRTPSPTPTPTPTPSPSYEPWIDLNPGYGGPNQFACDRSLRTCIGTFPASRSTVNVISTVTRSQTSGGNAPLPNPPYYVWGSVPDNSGRVFGLPRSGNPVSSISGGTTYTYSSITSTTWEQFDVAMTGASSFTMALTDGRSTVKIFRGTMSSNTGTASSPSAGRNTRAVDITPLGVIVVGESNGDGQAYISTNNASAAFTLLPASPQGSYSRIVASDDGGAIFASVNITGDPVHYSPDGGTTWSSVGLYTNSTIREIACTSDGTLLFIVASDYIYNFNTTSAQLSLDPGPINAVPGGRVVGAMSADGRRRLVRGGGYWLYVGTW
jgi:hypothetical protein